MPIVFQNTAEGGVPGQGVTAGNSGGASGTPWSLINIVPGGSGAPATYARYTDQNPLDGLISVISQSHEGSAQGNIFRWTPPTALSRFAMRHRRRFLMNGKLPDGGVVLYSAQGGTGTTGAVNLISNTSGRLLVQNAASAAVGFGDVLPTDGTPVTIELIAIPGTTTSNGYVKARWYTTDPANPGGEYESSTFNCGTSPIARMQWGRVSGLWYSLLEMMDSWAVSDEAAFIGPPPKLWTPGQFLPFF